MKLSHRSSTVPGSPTLALAAKALELKSKGVDVISFSVGEPDWESFAVCKNAGVLAIQNGKTRYTPAPGIPSLRSALAEKFNSRFPLDWRKENVLVTPGAKYAIQQALWAMVDTGEKVGTFAPYWPSYTTMIEIAEAHPVVIPLQSDFSLCETSIKKALDQGVSTLLINSPNNPSGQFLKLSDYRLLRTLMNKYKKLKLILDDIYAELYWGEGEQCPHYLDVALNHQDRVALIGGASKAYSMTGWRLGWLASGDDVLVQAVGKYQSQTTGCPSAIAQEAALSGILNGQEDLKLSVQKLKKRAKQGAALLNAIPGVSVLEPESAFYFWVDVSEILKQRKLTSVDFCQQLLEEQALVVVPGKDFGQEGFLRMSFAVGEELFEQGVKRFAAFLAC